MVCLKFLWKYIPEWIFSSARRLWAASFREAMLLDPHCYKTRELPEPCWSNYNFKTFKLLIYRKLIPVKYKGIFFFKSALFNSVFLAILLLSPSLMENKVITESQDGLGWHGPLKSLVPAPSWGWEHLSLGHISHSPVQPDFKYFQWWGTHNFTGQPVPVLNHPHSAELLSSLNQPSFSLKSSRLILQALVKASPSFLQPPSGTERPLLVDLPGSFSKLKTHLSRPFFTGEVFHPSDHLSGSSGLALTGPCPPYTGGSRWGLRREERRRGIVSLELLSMLVFVQPRIGLAFCTASTPCQLSPHFPSAS